MANADKTQPNRARKAHLPQSSAPDPLLATYGLEIFSDSNLGALSQEGKLRVALKRSGMSIVT